MFDCLWTDLPFATLQLAFVGLAIIGGIVLYKVFQGSSVEGAIRETKGSIKGTYNEAKGSVRVRAFTQAYTLTVLTLP